MSDIKEYIKELTHLKSMGIINGEQAEELNNLIKLMEELETKNQSVNADNDKFKIPIKFVNTSKNEDPTWAKDGDSGFDLRAELTEVGGKLTLKPFERTLIPTGLYFELPQYYDMEIKSRSGLALKYGIGILTGTIDRDYRGEVKVLLINLGSENFVINQGDRIAQAIIRPRVSTEYGKMIKLDSIKNLSETDRSSNGFGSTGKT